jgi:hypothetical protein
MALKFPLYGQPAGVSLQPPRIRKLASQKKVEFTVQSAKLDDAEQDRPEA